MTCDAVAGRVPRRRRAVRAGAALATVLALVVAGCGGGGGGDGEDAGGDDGGSPAPPAEDDRVVVLAEEFVLADVLDLGIRPVASTVSVPEVGFQGMDGYDTDGIEVLPMTTLSLEHLASLRPDAIVTLQFWADQVGEEALAGMGDLLLIPDGLTASERLTELGEMLDRPDEAAALVADLDEATERARSTVPEDCAVSLAAIYPGPTPAVFVDGPWDLPTSILSTGCALDPDAAAATPDENGRVYLSMEQLDILDAPTLVLLQSETVAGEQEAVEDIETNPLWAGLPAVEGDNVVVFDRLGYPGASGQIRFPRGVHGALRVSAGRAGAGRLGPGGRDPDEAVALRGHEPGVGPAGGDELVVGAALGDAAAVEDDDPVGGADGG
jgi:iron complex transport system substrate-binding protein